MQSTLGLVGRRKEKEGGKMLLVRIENARKNNKAIGAVRMLDDSAWVTEIPCIDLDTYFVKTVPFNCMEILSSWKFISKEGID